MKSKIIAFINEKGGIGKSSCCFNLAWHLAEKKKVLMIDFDGQKANLSFFTGVEKSDSTLTMFDVLMSGESIRNTIQEVKKNLHIIPAMVNVTFLNQTAKTTRLRKVLAEIREDYDYIFIDVNPTPNWTHYLALSCSDFVVIPMLPDIASLEANTGIIESIEEAQETINPNLKVLGVLFNKYTERTNLSKEVQKIAKTLADRMDSKVFDAKIRNAVALGENIGEHIGITEYAPKSAAASDFVQLSKEIEKEVKKHSKGEV